EIGLYNGLYGYRKYYSQGFPTSNFLKIKIPVIPNTYSIYNNGMTLYAKASIIGSEEDIFGVYNAKVLYGIAPTEGFNQSMPFIAHTNSGGSPAIAAKFSFDETLPIVVPENTVLDCFFVKYPGETNWEFYIFDKTGLISSTSSSSTSTSDYYSQDLSELHSQLTSANYPSAEGLSRIVYAGGYWTRPLNMQEMMYISKNPNSLSTGINKIIPIF
ncbi:MAG TPA: hypothetical protein V6C58_03435, partial [Allocoleopsis sp.]